MNKESGFSTRSVHSGEENHNYAGAVVTPIFLSSTYIHTAEDDLQNMKYIRLSNSPNHEVLHKKIANLESAPAACSLASGMAAISTAITTFFEEPGHLLSQNNIYGTAYYFLTQDFKRMGHSVSFCDFTKKGNWESYLTPKTKAVYVESLSNPLLEVQDLVAVVQFAKQHGLMTIIDNTFLSPINFRPYELGFDIVIHSASKYLNGHSDLVAGSIAASEANIKKILTKMKHFGGILDPHTCFLLNRGMKTLALRTARHNQNSEALANYLSKHPKVEKVFYPGLKTHPAYSIAKELFSGLGGVVSFELKGTASDADLFMQKLEFAQIAPSLGGVESLVTRPAFTSHVGIPSAERKKLGINDTLIRYSTGIEDTDDLIKDFEQALT